jgi:predicted DNA-binding protein (UPF0251 family)
MADIEEKHVSRFWSRVDREGPGGCWIWKACTAKGYGRLRVGSRNVTTHRFSYALHVGPIPEGMCVCHRCDNPLCVNPGHLFLGTNQENTADRVAKRRSSRAPHPVFGERHASAKLTPDDVRKIRATVSSGLSQRKAAAALGLKRSAVKYALDGWRSVK